jgi:effector-binding domain-containing protein
VGQLLEDDVTPDELRGMMRLRQTELVEQIAADRARLARVEARLRIIEGEGSMSTTDVTITATPGVRLASLRGHAPSAGLEDVGPVVSGLFERAGALAAGSGHGEAMASYQTLEDGSLDCRAGFVLPDATHAPDGLEVVELPALESAAVLQHHGCMEDIGGSYQRLAVWIEENGYRTDGSARERYLVSYPEPEDDWVTAIEMPVSTS